MGISTVPNSTEGLTLRQTITTSGWYDLGNPKPITVIIAGGGGGGGGTQTGTTSGGGGGGGGAGAMICKMFIGGRVYVALGAGGIAGVGTSQAGLGGNSLFIYPMGRQERGSTVPTTAIKVGGGGYGGYGAQSVGETGGTGAPGLSGGTGISLSGYSITTAIGDSGSNGASGAGSSTVATNPAGYGNFYPNVAQPRLVSTLSGWRTNNLARFDGATTSTINFTFPVQNDVFLASDPNDAMPFLDESGSTYAVPKSYFTSGTIAYTGVSTGGTPGSASATQAQGGGSGYLTGGGAGGPAAQNGGSGGSSVMYRGGLGGFTLGVTNVGGGGGAGIAGPGANGVTATGSGGGFGGNGGLGGGGGGGGQGAKANGSNGGKGGDGACLIYW